MRLKTEGIRTCIRWEKYQAFDVLQVLKIQKKNSRLFFSYNRKMRKKKWLSNDINKTKMKNRPYKVTRWNISVKGMREMCVDSRLYNGCIFHVRQSAVLTIDKQWSCFCFDFLCVYRLSLYDSASRLLSLHLQETKIKTNSPWHKLRWRRLNNHCLCRFIVIVIKSCTLLFGWRCCFLLARSFFLAIDIIFSDGFFSVYVRVIRFLCDCFDFFLSVSLVSMLGGSFLIVCLSVVVSFVLCFVLHWF